MSGNTFPTCLSVVLLVWVVGCSPQGHNGLGTSLPPTKYKIDGLFDDWKTHETINTDTGIDWSKVVMTGYYNGIHFRDFYEDSDSNYLYLFFKFKPSIQERYDRTHSGGALGYLYIDTDANTNTGCTDLDAEGGTVSGSEIQIYFPIGIYMNLETNGCDVSYEIERWNSASKNFDETVRTADSRDSEGLIAHGEDGVEAALPLADLQVTGGSHISLAFWGDLVPKKYIKRTTIQLR